MPKPNEETALALTPSQPFSLTDMQVMAGAIAKSRLFPSCQTPENALALMLLCQAEGLHPVQAARRYHVINGQCTMRADSMLAEFQRQGGSVQWKEFSSTAARAVFSHPAGGSIEFAFTLAEAKQAGLVRSGGNWDKYPAAMLRARCISGAVRMILPGVVSGIYTPEEVADFDEKPAPRQAAKKTVSASVEVKHCDCGAEIGSYEMLCIPCTDKARANSDKLMADNKAAYIAKQAQEKELTAAQATAAAEALSAQIAERPPAGPMVDVQMIRRIDGLLGANKISTPEAKHAEVVSIIGRTFGVPMELSEAEGKVIIAKLEYDLANPPQGAA